MLVVGGGITGAGVALDAAGRGLRTALVERGDFAAGTSSRSSKLVHGGLRYLQQKEFRLVYEALAERQRLLRLAPHLVKPLPFLIPVFARRSGRSGPGPGLRPGGRNRPVDVRRHRRGPDRQAAQAAVEAGGPRAHARPRRAPPRRRVPVLRRPGRRRPPHPVGDQDRRLAGGGDRQPGGGHRSGAGRRPGRRRRPHRPAHRPVDRGPGRRGDQRRRGVGRRAPGPRRGRQPPVDPPGQGCAHHACRPAGRPSTSPPCCRSPATSGRCSSSPGATGSTSGRPTPTTTARSRTRSAPPPTSTTCSARSTPGSPDRSGATRCSAPGPDCGRWSAGRSRPSTLPTAGRPTCPVVTRCGSRRAGSSPSSAAS